jgi:hypothetical protein
MATCLFGPSRHREGRAQPTPDPKPKKSRDLLRSLSNQNNVQLAVQIVYLPKHMLVVGLVCASNGCCVDPSGRDSGLVCRLLLFKSWMKKNRLLVLRRNNQPTTRNWLTADSRSTILGLAAPTVGDSISPCVTPPHASTSVPTASPSLLSLQQNS